VESQAVPDEAARAEWLAKSKMFTRGGAVLTYGASALDQVMEDSGRSDLSTTDKVGRAAGASAYVGSVSLAGGAAGAWAGAEGGAVAGGAIGSVIPVVGTAAGAAVGGVVGAIGGGIVGSGLAGAAADATKGFAVHAGQAAANWTVDQANGLAHDASHVWAETEGARQTVAHVASGAWDKTSGVRHTVSDVADALNPF
jgi:phage tail tape-measure protein